MSVASAERRLQQLEAKQQLAELVARYGMAIDDRDLDPLMDLFTEDGVFRHDAAIQAKGRPALKEFYAGVLRNYGASLHYPHSQVVDWAGDGRATGVVVAHAELAAAGTAVVVALRYYDSYERGEDGQWRFAERHLRFWYFMRLDELPEHMSERDRKRWPGPPAPAELPESLATYRSFHGA